MNQFLVAGGQVVTPHESFDPGYVLIEGGTIEAVGPFEDLEKVEGFTEIDATGAIVLPGLVDTHVHGRQGHEFGESIEIAQELCKDIVSTGVTSLLPTLVARPTLEDLLDQIEVIRIAREVGMEGAEILGLHMEGPYFSSAEKARGSQPVANFRSPSVEEVHRFLETSGNAIRKMSIAPELEGALQVIKELAAHDVVASAGHSAASYDRAVEAIMAGVRCSTHTFNGMVPFHHRSPGLVAAILLSDEVSAEVIADGEHVSPEAIRLLLRCKGTDGVHVVTDNTIYAGLPDGDYPDPDRDRLVRKERNRVFVVGGTLTGSVGSMNKSLQLLVEKAGCSLSEAIKMATVNPAELIGVQDRKGELRPGHDADLVVLEKDFSVRWTMARGRVAFERGNNTLGE